MPAGPDYQLEQVFDFLQSRCDFVSTVGSVIRVAIDTVLDGGRTGRFDLEAGDVNKNEKTFLGSLIEFALIERLSLSRGETLDTVINGIEVDIKTTISNNWMIPREAVGELCLLIRSSDRDSTFGVGLVRTDEERLVTGQNQDKKRSLTAAAKQTIQWFGRSDSHGLQQNFLLHMQGDDRAAVLAHESGQKRARELLRLCQDVAIPRVALMTVARQLDPMKRVRDARKHLRAEGIRVLSSTRDARQIAELGVLGLPDTFFVSTMRRPQSQ